MDSNSILERVTLLFYTAKLSVEVLFLVFKNIPSYGTLYWITWKKSIYFSHIKWTCPHRYIRHTSGFGKCERRVRKKINCILSLVHFPCGHVLDNSYCKKTYFYHLSCSESPHPTRESLFFTFHKHKLPI